MNIHKNKLSVLILPLLFMGISFSAFSQQKGTGALAEKLLALTPATIWNKVDSIPLKFDAYHTQGMVRIGEYFFLTAVEVKQWPQKYPVPEEGLDRDAGVGKGHVFKFDQNGNLLKDLVIGEADVYHPGGIDYDGKYIWIPVTEYRPHSFSIIYRLDPVTMELMEILRCKDSIGAIVHNTDANTLVGMNWNARLFYTWKLNKSGVAKDKKAALEQPGIENPSFYVAFQDCKYLGNNLMLGSGHELYQNAEGKYRLGAWEVVDLKDFRPRRQVPVKLWSVSGASMLNNPCAVELTNHVLRAYFVPDDNHAAVLYVYDLR